MVDVFGRGIHSFRVAAVFGLFFAHCAFASPAPAAPPSTALLQLSTPEESRRIALSGAASVAVASLPDRQSTEASITILDATGTAAQRVIVQLRAQPVVQRAALRSIAARRAMRASFADEHSRVGSEILRLEGAQQRSATSPIHREFVTAFNGIAATLLPTTIAALRANPDVLAVYPDREVKAVLDTSVPVTEAPTFWAAHEGYRGAGVVVAVVDTGIDYTHADLGGCVTIGAPCKVIGGYDFNNGDADPLDDHGHGTHVSATIAGNGSLVGMAPEASLLAYKVLDANGSGYSSNVIAGIDAAVDPNGDLDTEDRADVINMSLGGAGDPDDPTSQAVDNATAAGVLVVVAAGNSGGYFTIGSPGAARTALTVGAISRDGVPAYFTSGGPIAGTLDLKPEVSAPGVDICAARAAGTTLGTPCKDDTHVLASGTSMATPHVAGAAALLRGLYPSLSPEDIKSLIAQNGKASTYDALQVGASTLDVAHAAEVHTVVSPQTLSFGRDVMSQPIWQAMRTLTVRNIGRHARSYSLSAADQYWGLPASASITFTPNTFSLAAGASQVVQVDLRVDNSSPAALSSPYVHEATISVDSTGETQRVPAVYVEAGVLRIHSDIVPSMIYVHDGANLSSAQAVVPTGTTAEILITPGIYDVVVMFPVGIASFAVHQNVTVGDTTDETVFSSELVHTVTFGGRNEFGTSLGHSVREMGIFRNGTDIGIGTFSFYVAGPFTMSFNTIGADYDLDFAALSQTLGKSYLFTRGLSGISSSVLLDNTPAELTRGQVRYFEDPGQTERDVTEFVSMMVGGIGIGIGINPVSPMDRDLWVTPSPRANSRLFTQPQQVLDLPGGAVIAHYSPWYRGGTTTGRIEACNPMDRTTSAYETTTGDLPIDLGPASFFLKMYGYGYGASLWPEVAAWTWSFHFPGGDGPESETGTLGYRLRFHAAPLSSGILPQSGFGGPYLPFLSFPDVGVYTFETDPLEYALAGLSATVRTNLTFDTRLANDSAPPYIRRLEVRSAGVLTDVAPTGANAIVLVEAHDDVDAAPTIALLHDDAGIEVPVALTSLGDGNYEATIACEDAGPYNAVVVITDASGNEIRQWQRPLFACRAAGCGDGNLDDGEACDDGNTISGDGCNSLCSGTESCGDGVRDVGEGCDDGNTAAGDCCSPSCQVEAEGSRCDDDAFCNGADSCDALGGCTRHAGSPCESGTECNRGCDEAANSCTFTHAGRACTSDGNDCTDDLCDGAGTCASSANTAFCDDGVFCNGADACAAGSCSDHSGDPCLGGGECNETCGEATFSCTALYGTPCSDDALPCTVDFCDGGGSCAHDIGNAGVICRDAADPCDVPEVCDGQYAACPADTGITDTDADSVCDGLDVCTNVAGAQNFLSPPKARLAIGNILASTTPGDDTMTLVGSFRLPATTSFAALFPMGGAAHIALYDKGGVQVVDIVLPRDAYPGTQKRGWTEARSGKVWTYLDKSQTPVGGIVNLLLKADGGSIGVAGGRVKVRLVAKKGDFPFLEADSPVKIAIAFGDQAASAAGICAESAFVASDCVWSASKSQLICKR